MGKAWIFLDCLVKIQWLLSARFLSLYAAPFPGSLARESRHFIDVCMFFFVSLDISRLLIPSAPILRYKRLKENPWKSQLGHVLSPEISGPLSLHLSESSFQGF